MIKTFAVLHNFTRPYIFYHDISIEIRNQKKNRKGLLEKRGTEQRIKYCKVTIGN